MNYTILLILIISYLEIITAKLVQLENPIDLTWPFDDNTIYWPNSQPFVFTKQFAGIGSNGIWYSINEFCTGEHGGTHLDAPYHFNEFGWKVGDIPLSRLIVRGIMIDLSEETEVFNDKAVLLPEHLEAWVKAHGSIPDNSVILVKFGWSKYYSNRTQYLGIDQEKKLNFPGISSAAADWIVQSGKVVGVGVDTASLDPGASSNYSAHITFSKNQIYGLENVKLPAVFPENDFGLYVMPMKISEGTGAPLRLIAVPLGTDMFLENVAVIKSPFYVHVALVCLVLTITNTFHM